MKEELDKIMNNAIDCQKTNIYPKYISKNEIKEILTKYDYQHRLDLELLAELESYISSHYIAKEKVYKQLRLLPVIRKGFYNEQTGESEDTIRIKVLIDELIKPTPTQQSLDKGDIQ